MRCEPIETSRGIKDTVAMRDAYCGELIRLAEQNPNIVPCDGGENHG